MSANTITLVAAVLAFAASIIATAVAAFNGRFGKFAREKWWERQAEAYTRIIEALAGMVYYHEEHLSAYEEGRKIPEGLKAETVQHWQRSYAELKKASAVGAFLISADAEAALRKMWKDKDKAIDSQDWYSQLENDYVTARDCLKSMVEHAKHDLETRRREARAPVRRGLRKFASTVAAIVIVAAALWGVSELRSGRRWPFSTGTRDVAFLSTTFGMSPQEVRRTLAGFGVPLMTRDEYKSIEPTRLFIEGFTPLFYEDRDEVTMYMPGIEMFDSKVDADFSFRQDRLWSISAYFDPLRASTVDAVVSALDGGLQAKFQGPSREDSKDVPGAYTLHYAHAGSPSLWVNLTDRAKPIVMLTVVDPIAQAARQAAILTRQQNAFGGR
jgi:hypothetical protein